VCVCAHDVPSFSPLCLLLLLGRIKHHPLTQVPEGSRRKDYEESELVLYKHALLVGQGKIQEGAWVSLALCAIGSGKSSSATICV